MAKTRRWDSQLFTNITDVDISDITADPTMQQRHAMRDSVITEYMEVLLAGGELAPIKLIKSSDGTYWLWDGFHTLQAAKKLNRQAIKSEVEHGTKRDAWLKSLGANDKHGIRRSKLDLYKAIDNALSDPDIRFSLLNEDKQYSFRSVAKLCAAGHQTISKRWQEKHLPHILIEIDKAVNSEVDFDEAWLDRISETLLVPHWLTLERWEICKIRELEAEAPNAEASDDHFTSGRTTTRQVEEAPNAEASDDHFTSGRATTRQVEEALNAEASDDHFTSGRTTTRQVDDALNTEASDDHFTSGRATTRQVDEAPNTEASDDHFTSGRTTTHQVGQELDMEIRLQGTKEGLGLALRKLEQVFEIVKYPQSDYPTRNDPELIHWYITVR